MKTSLNIYRIRNETYEYVFSAVPSGGRKRTTWLLLVAMGYAFSISGATMGAKIGSSTTFYDAALTCFVGNLFMFFIALFWGLRGYETGETCVVLVQKKLGKPAAQIFSVLIMLSTMVWVGINGELLASVVMAIFPKWPFPLPITSLLLIGLGVLLTLRGWRDILRLMAIAVPLISLLTICTVTRIVMAKDGLAFLFAYQPVSSVAVPEALTMVMGNFFISAVTIPNLCRFAKSRRAVWGCASAYAVILMVSNLCGILIVQATEARELTYGIYLLGMIPTSFLWSILCSYTTQCIHLYNGSLAVQSLAHGTAMGGNISHELAILFMGGLAAIESIIGTTGFVSKLASILVLILVTLTGTMWAETRLSRGTGAGGRTAALSAWGVSILAGWGIWNLLGSTGWPLLFLAAAGIYELLRFLMRRISSRT